jgi:hypothetical protein
MMERWLILVYPAAVGYLIWLVAQSRHDRHSTLRPAAMAVLSVVGITLALSSLLVGILGPVWILMVFAGWRLEASSLLGTVIGLLVVFGSIGWVLSGDGADGTRPSNRERVLLVADLIATCAFPVLFVLGQCIALGVGGFAGDSLARLLVAHLSFPAWIEDGFCQMMAMVVGITTMAGGVYLASIVQDRQMERARTSKSSSA